MPSSFRYFDRHRAGIDISELLHPTGRQFQLAFQLVFIEYRELIDGIVAASDIKDESAIGLARVSLANYFAAALLMAVNFLFPLPSTLPNEPPGLCEASPSPFH